MCRPTALVVLGLMCCASCGDDDVGASGDSADVTPDAGDTTSAGGDTTATGGDTTATGGDTTSGDTDTPVDTAPPTCLIAGTSQPAGAIDPDNPCQVCDPARSTSAWSARPDEASCGASQACFAGACETVCLVFGLVLRDGAVDPHDPCRVCAVATATDTLGARPDGSACASDRVCVAGLCHDGCFIDGQAYGFGVSRAEDACLSCWPPTSPITWTENGSCGPDGGPGACADTQTDAANCGICGHACAIAPCTAGRCADYPLDLTRDEANVYWTNYGSGTVERRRVDGGSEVTLASGQSQPWGIAVASPWVYWTSYAGGTVMRTRIDGTGTPEPVASAQVGPQSMLRSESHIWWANYASQTVGSINRIELDGTGHVVLTDAHCPVSSGKICFGDVTSMAVSDDHLFWASHGGARVFFRAALDDLHQIEALFGSIGWDRPIAVAADDTHWYFGVAGPGAIYRVPLAGGEPEPLTTGIVSLNDLAVDDTHVYWTDLDPVAGGIGRVVKDATGTAEVFAPSPSARYLIVDPTHVTWTTFAPTGGIVRQAK